MQCSKSDPSGGGSLGLGLLFMSFFFFFFGNLSPVETFYYISSSDSVSLMFALSHTVLCLFLDTENLWYEDLRKCEAEK